MYCYCWAFSKDSADRIRKSCITFYIDIISTLCFNSWNPPSSELVHRLLETVFSTEGNLTPFMSSGQSHKAPIIRSFLLQLLLRQRWVLCHVCVCFWLPMHKFFECAGFIGMMVWMSTLTSSLRRWARSTRMKNAFKTSCSCMQDVMKWVWHRHFTTCGIMMTWW